MINHPSGGITLKEAHRQELIALAARERQARFALRGLPKQATALETGGRLGRLLARFPLAVRPPRRVNSPATISMTQSGECGRAVSRRSFRDTPFDLAPAREPAAPVGR